MNPMNSKSISKLLLIRKHKCITIRWLLPSFLIVIYLYVLSWFINTIIDKNILNFPNVIFSQREGGSKWSNVTTLKEYHSDIEMFPPHLFMLNTSISHYRTKFHPKMKSAKIIEQILEHNNNSCLSVYHNVSAPIKNQQFRNLLHIRYANALYLYSFGGSGNSFMRLLLEYITAIPTGSCFADKGYKKIFKREGTCNDELLVCKAHPRWFYAKLPLQRKPGGSWRATAQTYAKSDGLVWIIRNPWNAMWSLYQFRRGGFSDHGSKISVSNFDKSNFYQVLYVGTLEISLFEHWVQQFEVAKELLIYKNRNWTNDISRIVFVKYEDLIDENKRIDEMMKIIHHLYDLNDSNINKDYFFIPTQNGIIPMNYQQLIVRIHCGFDFCDTHSKKIKREHNEGNKEKFMTMKEAYSSLEYHQICRIWHCIKKYAQPLGYTQLFHETFQCQHLNITYDDVDNVHHPNMTRIAQLKKNRKKRKRPST